MTNNFYSYVNERWKVARVKFEVLLSLSQFRKFILKLVSAIFYQIFICSSSDRLSKTMKNVFYFILKALFVLEIFKFLYFFHFYTVQIQKSKWKWNNLWCHKLACINLQISYSEEINNSKESTLQAPKWFSWNPLDWKSSNLIMKCVYYHNLLPQLPKYHEYVIFISCKFYS